MGATGSMAAMQGADYAAKTPKRGIATHVDRKTRTGAARYMSVQFVTAARPRTPSEPGAPATGDVHDVSCGRPRSRPSWPRSAVVEPFLRRRTGEDRAHLSQSPMTLNDSTAAAIAAPGKRPHPPMEKEIRSPVGNHAAPRWSRRRHASAKEAKEPFSDDSPTHLKALTARSSSERHSGVSACT
jgi:hypothetical protein